MKNPRRFSAVLFIGLLALAGCQYLDTTSQPTGMQVLNVTVSWPAGVTLPADSSVTVLLIDSARNDAPLDAQTVVSPGTPPVALRFSYRAEDINPPHRVRIEARASVGGRLAYRSNRQRNFLTPDNATQTFALMLDPLGSSPAAGISVAPGKSYVVKQGDTLAVIAQRAGITLKELLQANPGLSPTLLKVGQQLSLPVGE